MTNQETELYKTSIGCSIGVAFEGRVLDVVFNISNPRSIRVKLLAMKVSLADDILARHALTTEIVVRDLIKSDCAALEWHGGTDFRAWYHAQWRNHRDELARVLIADVNNFPIGQVAVHWHGKPTHPLVPDVQSLRVFPAFRGLKIGSLLLDCAEGVVRERGFSHISLSVALDNPRAQKLYERLGYHVFGDIYHDEWQYIDARGETHTVREEVLDLVKHF